MLVNRTPDSEKQLLIEYFHEGRWAKGYPGDTITFSRLKAGDAVRVRISYRRTEAYKDTEYNLSFGSYPFMKDVKLTAPPVWARVGAGNTGWVVGVQTYEELSYELQYTDSTGAPLKGSYAKFNLYLDGRSKEPDFFRLASADDTGKIDLTFKLDRCYDSEVRAEQNDDEGVNYGIAGYKIVRWFVSDELVGPENFEQQKKWTAAFALHCIASAINNPIDR